MSNQACTCEALKKSERRVTALEKELALLQGKWVEEGNKMYACEYGTFYWKGLPQEGGNDE